MNKEWWELQSVADLDDQQDKEQKASREAFQQALSEYLANDQSDLFGHRVAIVENEILPLFQNSRGFIGRDSYGCLLVCDREFGPFCLLDEFWTKAVWLKCEAGKSFSPAEFVNEDDFEPCPFCSSGARSPLSDFQRDLIPFFDEVCGCCADWKVIPKPSLQSLMDEMRGMLADLRSGGDYCAAEREYQYNDIDRYSKFIELDPADLESILGRARALKLRKEHALAVSDYERAVELAPDQPWGYAGKAYVLQDCKQFPASLEQFDLAIEAVRKRLPRDWRDFESLSKRDDLDSRYHGYESYLLEARALLLERMGRLDEALHDINAAMDKRHGDFGRDRIRILRKLGKDDEADKAKQEYEEREATRRNPIEDEDVNELSSTPIDPFYPRSVYIANRDEAEVLIKKCTAALQSNPGDGEAYNQRAEAFVKIKDNDAAIADFRQVVRLHPSYSFAYTSIAELQIEVGAYDSALSTIDDALERCGRDSRLLILRAKVQEMQGHLQEAIENLNEASTFEPEYERTDISRVKGPLLERLGHMEQAAVEKAKVAASEVELLKTVIQTNPSAVHLLVRHWECFDKRGCPVEMPSIDHCGGFAGGLAVARPSERFFHGFVDKEGHWSIPPQFSQARDFSQGLAAVSLPESPLSDPLFGYINSEGKLKIPPRYARADAFVGGLAGVKLDEQWGMIDQHGNEILQPVFQMICSISEDLVLVKFNGKYGYSDKSGHICISARFDEAWSFKDGRAAVRVDGKWGYIDRSGDVVVSPRFEDVHYYRDGVALVKEGDSWGIIDLDGNFVCTPSFESVLPFCCELAFARIGSAFGAINKLGEVVITPQFEEVQSFREGLAGVRIGSRWGFVNTLGELVVQPGFDEVKKFREGMCAVAMGELCLRKWGAIDFEGNLVLPCEFEHVSEYSEGLAFVGSL